MRPPGRPKGECRRAQPEGAPATPVVSVRGLRKRFTLHLRDGLQLPVLDDVSFDLMAGECVALVGPSGQGKSTLIKCLYGSYSADAGSMLLARDDAASIDLAQAEPSAWLHLRRREIAYVSQFLRVVPRVPALDVVAERRIAAHDNGEASHDLLQVQARDDAQRLLQRLNLPAGLWSLPPATFSGGEQQRVNIARGFIEPATLLLLDEPTASLDAMNRRVVIELIHEAKVRGSAVIGIFHDEEVRDAVADRRFALGESR